jgi:hypothetical protein
LLARQSPAAGKQIRFLVNSHDWTNEVIRPATAEFEQLTGIKVAWEIFPEDQFRQKLAVELVAGSGSVDGFIFSLILAGNSTRTLPVAIFNFVSYDSLNWGGLTAASSIITLPCWRWPSSSRSTSCGDSRSAR